MRLRCVAAVALAEVEHGPYGGGCDGGVHAVVGIQGLALVLLCLWRVDDLWVEGLWFDALAVGGQGFQGQGFYGLACHGLAMW